MRTCEIQIIEGCCIDFLKKNSIHFMSRAIMTPNIVGCLTYIEMFRQSLLAVLTYLASAITTNRLLLKMKWIVVWKPKCNFLFLHRRIKPKLNGLKRCHQIPEEQWDINDRFLLENYWCHLRLHHRRYHYLHPPENAKKEHVMLGNNANFKSYNPGKYINVYVVFIYLQQHLARICVPD